MDFYANATKTHDFYFFYLSYLIFLIPFYGGFFFILRWQRVRLGFVRR